MAPQDFSEDTLSSQSDGHNMRDSATTDLEEVMPIPVDEESAKPTSGKVTYMSLPNKTQLAILCIARLADPLASSSIQSYMFYQLKFFDPSISTEMLSTQVGIIVGAKTAAQVCTGMIWGRMADSEYGGRKAVLTLGLITSGLAMIGYGFSTTFLSAASWQVFGGAMNSNVAIVRCVVAELNPEKRYRARALLLLPVMANAGMLLGPLIGGFLSAQHGDGIFKGYPYAGPNILIGAIYAVAAAGVFFGLHETLEILQHTESFSQRVWKRITRSNPPPHHGYSAISPEESTSEPNSPTFELSPPSPVAPLIPRVDGPLIPKKRAKLAFRRIWTRNVLCTMLAHFIIAGHLSTFGSLWAVFLSTPISRIGPSSPVHFTGGLGMLPREVGLAMAILGGIGVTFQLIIYPLLNDRFGAIKVWQGALFIFPLVYTLAPFPALVASSSSTPHPVTIWLSMLTVLVLFVIGRGGVTPATTLLINDCTPHPSVRGTIHTTGTVVGNLSRTFFPFIALAIFGQGLKVGVVGLGFWALAALACVAVAASRWVVEGSNGQDFLLEEEEEVATDNRATR